MQAVIGWNMTLTDVQRIGERRLNLLRMFNAREGAGREADTLPKHLFDKPLQGGPSNGLVISHTEFEVAMDTHYRLAGWGERGIPTKAKLEEFGLGWLA